MDVGGDGGPEAAARAARYAALAAAADGARVALGHTLDDQAETVLLGLGRGSGPRSVAGMVEHRETGGVHWWRPLLGVRRATTRAACAALELPVWDDPWNADPAYTRVRLRAEVLPLLEEVLGGGVAPALARTAALLARGPRRPRRPGRRRTRRAWPTATCRPATSARCPTRCGGACCSAGCAQRGVPDLQAVHLHAVDALLVRWRGQGRVDLPGGAGVVRASGRLVLQPPDGRGGDPRTAADDPEELHP